MRTSAAFQAGQLFNYANHFAGVPQWIRQRPRNSNLQNRGIRDIGSTRNKPQPAGILRRDGGPLTADERGRVELRRACPNLLRLCV